MDENEVISQGSLIGLTSQEEFKLKHSLANENKNARPLGTPKEIANILKKAKENGNSNKDIASFLDAKYALEYQRELPYLNEPFLANLF